MKRDDYYEDKKILIPLMAVSMVAGAMPISNVSASNDPKIYVDLHYEDDGDIRADIMFENLPTLYAGGFHIDFGDSWVNAVNDHGVHFSYKDTTAHEYGANVTYEENGEHGGFISFFSYYGNTDFNGRFYSIYLKKSENFNSDTAGINVVYMSDGRIHDTLYHMEDDNSLTNLLSNTLQTTPTMLGAYEYKVGDVNNDGYVDAVDTSLIWSEVQEHGAYDVNDIKYTYKSIFPKAKCAAVPDANQDGYISYLDGDLIMQYYADMSTDNVNNTNVGKIDIFELFDD